jgi:hypothetical protein
MINPSEDDINDFQTKIREGIEFDDTVAELVPVPSIGSRVRYREGVEDFGTIIQIRLHDAAFRVKWDSNTTVDVVDWFTGCQLEFI